MKILYFSQNYSPHDHRFLNALSASGYKVCYLRLEDPKEKLELRSLPSEVEQLGVLNKDNSEDWMKYPRKLRSIVGSEKPDLIHAGPVQKCAFLVALAGLHPLLTLSWGSDILLEADKTSFMTFATQYALNETDILAADCRAVLEKAASMGFPLERTVQFPWGVDLDHFTKTDDSLIRKELGWQNNSVLLSLRSWEPLYGVDIIVKGFAIASRADPSLRLLLLGDGSQKDEIQTLIHDLHLEKIIHICGRIGQDTLPHYYHAADLYLSASHSDGSSVSLMEALACGLPAIVSDIPGNREWLGDGEAGWLFPDNNAGEMADCILRALKDHQVLTNKGTHARKLAESKADWSRNFPVLLKGYEMAMQNKGLK